MLKRQRQTRFYSRGCYSGALGGDAGFRTSLVGGLFPVAGQGHTRPLAGLRPCQERQWQLREATAAWAEQVPVKAGLSLVSPRGQAPAQVQVQPFLSW